MKGSSSFPLFGIVLFLVVVFSAQGALGDGAKPRYSDAEVIRKLPKKEPKPILCYNCTGCSDATKLTPGTQKECKGAGFYRTKDSEDQDRPHDEEPAAYYRPHCYITFGPHGVIERGCLPEFLDQHINEFVKRTTKGNTIVDSHILLSGKCSEMKHEKGAFNGFTCWCAGKLCNFGTLLGPRIEVMVAAVLGVAAFNILYHSFVSF